jgi:hypothetical protein
MSTPSGFTGTIFDRRAVDLNRKLAPVWQRRHRHAERTPKPLGGDNCSFRGLPVGEQKRCHQRDRVQRCFACQWRR